LQQISYIIFPVGDQIYHHHWISVCYSTKDSLLKTLLKIAIPYNCIFPTSYSKVYFHSRTFGYLVCSFQLKVLLKYPFDWAMLKELVSDPDSKMKHNLDRKSLNDRFYLGNDSWWMSSWACRLHKPTRMNKQIFF
jgi:hypothetical protein